MAIVARGLAADLARREAEGRPVRVAVIGCGEMGTDLVTQIARMKGIRVAGIADRRGTNAIEAIRIARLPAEMAAPVEGLPALDAAIEAARIGIVDDAHLCCAPARSMW